MEERMEERMEETMEERMEETMEETMEERMEEVLASPRGHIPHTQPETSGFISSTILLTQALCFQLARLLVLFGERERERERESERERERGLLHYLSMLVL